jgi:hypothetical protein
LGDFTFGLVGGVVDFGFEAFEEALEEGVSVDGFVLHVVGIGDVTGEVGEDDSPGEGVLPCSAAEADVLALFGYPDAENFKGGFVALRRRRWGEGFVGCHSFSLSGNELRTGRWFDYGIEG